MKRTGMMLLLTLYSLVSFCQVCSDAYESNNTVGTATSFFSKKLDQSTANREIKGCIPKGDQDWFKIQVQHAGMLTIDLKDLPANLDLELYGATGLSNWLKGSTKTGTKPEQIQYSFSTQQQTTVYVKVYPATNNDFSTSKSYTLKIDWKPANPCTLPEKKPRNLSPGITGSSGSNIQTLTPLLKWDAVSDATSYGVYIRDMNSNDLILDNACATNKAEYQIPAGLLKANTLYRWNIKATVNCGSCISQFSDQFYFITSTGACIEPSQQAKNIVMDALHSTQATLRWSNGNGTKRIVKLNSSNSFNRPVTGTDPSANSSYVGGEQVIYNGSGNSVVVTGLTPNTKYWARIYEANCSSSSIIFNTSSSSDNPQSFQTSANCDEPKIINQPLVATVSSGNDAKFSLKASGSDLIYQWTVNEGNGTFKTIGNNSTYTGVNTDQLAIKSTTSQMNGFIFRCTVSNGCGSIYSEPVKLNVTTTCQEPTILKQPAAQHILVSTSASFTISISGSSLQYQWQLNTGNNQWQSLTNTSVYSNTTTSSLNIASVTASMNNYQYRVLVSNACGNKTSEIAKLTASNTCSSPQITDQPKDQTAGNGDAVVFDVSTSGTSIKHQWYYNTGNGQWQKIANNSIYSDYTSASLKILTATSSMNGYQFRNEISNACGAILSKSVKLTVTTSCIKPSLSTQPSSQSGHTNGSITFSTATLGTSPNLQWEENMGTGTWLALNDNNTYTGSKTTNLTIKNLPLAYNGRTYRLSLRNDCGTAVSNIVTLTVKTPITYKISGYVKDVSLDLSLGAKEIALEEFPNCTVMAYQAGTDIQVATDISSTSGYYELALPASGKYDLIAYSNKQNSLKVKQLNVATGTTIDLKIPYSILQSVQKQLTHLGNLDQKVSALNKVLPGVPSYDTKDQSALLSTWQKDPNWETKRIESLSRLYIADSIMRIYYGNAVKISDEISTQFYELIDMIASVRSQLKLLLSSITLNEAISNFQTTLITKIVDGIIYELYRIIEDWDKLQPSDELGIKLGLKVTLLQIMGAASTYSEIRKDIMEPFIIKLGLKLIGTEYIQRTQSSLDLSTQNAKNHLNTGSFKERFQDAFGKANTDKNTIDNLLIEAAEFRDKAGILSAYGAITGSLSSLTIKKAPAIISSLMLASSTFFSTLGFIHLQTAYRTALSAHYENIANLKPSILKSNNTISYPDLGKVKIASLQPVEKAVNEYNRLLTDLQSVVINGKQWDTASMTALQHASNRLRNEVNIALIPVQSSYITIAGMFTNLDSLLTTNFKATLDEQPASNLSFNYKYLAHSIEPTNTVTLDSLSKVITLLIHINNRIKNEFLGYYEIIKDLNALNYIQNLAPVQEKVFEKGTTKVFEFSFKNHGPKPTKNLYAKIVFDSLCKISIDSIYFGRLNEGESRRVKVIAQLPSIDTVLQYDIQFYDENLMADDFSGAFKLRARPASPILDYDEKLCIGDSLKLHATNTDIDLSYQWIGPNGFTSTQKNPIIPLVSQSHAGKYTCISIQEGLISDSASIDIVIKMPSIVISGDLQFCKGSSTILTASGANTYVWSTGTITPSIEITKPGNYQITAYNEIGCQDKKTVTIKQLDLPIANAGKDHNIGQGSTVQLGGSPAAIGAAPFVYTWSGLPSLQSNGQGNPLIKPLLTSSYTLEVKDANGCVASDSAIVTVTGYTAYPNPVMAGQSVTIIASNIPDGTYHLVLLDMNGKMMKQEKWIVENKIMNAKFYLPYTLTGAYQLRIIGEDQKKLIRLIVVTK